MMFSKWDVIDTEEGEFFLERLEDHNTEGERDVVITLCNSIGRGSSKRNHILKIKFNNPLCYRTSNTGDLSQSAIDVGQRGSFFLSSSSDYLDWFHQESLSNYVDDKLVHYKIITEFHVLDIVYDEPLSRDNVQYGKHPHSTQSGHLK